MIKIELVYGMAFFLFCISACTNKEEIKFTGYDPIDPTRAIDFDTLAINPVLLEHRDYPDPFVDTSYYWDIYSINKELQLIHVASSNSMLITDKVDDSLMIGDFKCSISNFFDRQTMEIRITQILQFEFKATKFLAIVTQDMFEGGNRSIDSKVILIERKIDSIWAICPPMLLPGHGNVQSFLGHYFCDLNADEDLDFLQWNKGDTIKLYSLVNHQFVKQKEFIKLYKDDPFSKYSLIDQRNSHWPYPYFKSSSKFGEDYHYDYHHPYY